MNKRIGIFCLYNANGEVEDYVSFLIKEMKSNLDRCIIVCNGKLTSAGEEQLKQYTEEIIVRKNEGYDAGAWKDIILEYLGEEELAKYDELVLLNDTFYGPFYPFKMIFDKMNSYQEVDFWGITIHGALKNPWKVLNDPILPEHLQSYFLVIKSRMLHCKEFLKYWETRRTAKTFEEAVCYNEIQFTKYFSELGYKYAAYCDTRKEEENNSVKINHYLFNARMLLDKYKCPMLKRKMLKEGKVTELEYNLGDEARFCIDYIKNNTEYDVKLIFKDLLKTSNVFELRENLALDYIFPLSQTENKMLCKKVLVVAHLYYPELFYYAYGYLKNIVNVADLVITTDDEIKIKSIEEIFRPLFMEKLTIIKVEKRGRDMAGMLVGARKIINQYDYFCFVHDKKSARDGQAMTVGSSFSNLLWDNVLASEGFVKNIINCFEREEQLGFLSVPAPYHGPYYDVSYNLWASAFNPALELAKQLDIKAPIEYGYPPIALGTTFWCKTNALKKLLKKEWDYSDFPAEPLPDDGTISHALERIFPYIAQDEGYYSGVVMNTDYASVEIENLRYLLRKNRAIFSSVISVNNNITFKMIVKKYMPREMWEILRRIKNRIIR